MVHCVCIQMKKKKTELCTTSYYIHNSRVQSLCAQVTCTSMNDVFDQHTEYTVTACDHITEYVLLHHRYWVVTLNLLVSLIRRTHVAGLQSTNLCHLMLNKVRFSCVCCTIYMHIRNTYVLGLSKIILHSCVCRMLVMEYSPYAWCCFSGNVVHLQRKTLPELVCYITQWATLLFAIPKVSNFSLRPDLNMND